MQKAEKIWLDGALLDWDAANVHVLTHTLHYGVGAFEGIRCYARADGRSALFRLREHIDRLYTSCSYIAVEIPFEREQLSRACLELLLANGQREVYVRLLVFLGDPEMGLRASNPVRVAIAAFPWRTSQEGRSLRAMTSTYTRGGSSSPVPHGKISGNYMTSVLAKRQASSAGFEEALLLDTAGNIAEASSSNVFWVRGRRLETAPLSSPILAGVTRDTVLRLARDLGIDADEELVGREELYEADEVFTTGTVSELRAVGQLDHRTIGSGKPGPMTQRLQQSFREVTRGEGTTHLEWLTYLSS
jgi:branched-chain amino acid aminotransferase